MDTLRNFGFLVRDVSRLSAKRFERNARDLELTLAQCKVLAHLSRNEGISQARLAELTETDPMTLVRILDRMQQDGWLERRPDPGDRRVWRTTAIVAVPFVAVNVVVAVLEPPVVVNVRPALNGLESDVTTSAGLALRVLPATT